jgi:hypothetical protein
MNFFVPPSLPSLESLRQINTPEMNQESSSVTLYKQPSASCKMFFVSVYFYAWLSLSEKYSIGLVSIYIDWSRATGIFILYADTLFFLKNEKLRS